MAKSHHLTLKIYTATKVCPNDELYSLSSQMRRSASSIPTNIAEGPGRKTDLEFKRFVIIASGSAAEVYYQLILSRDLLYISMENFKELYESITEIRKMLHSLINTLTPKANS